MVRSVEVKYSSRVRDGKWRVVNISAMGIQREKKMERMRRMVRGWRKETRRVKEERREKLEMLVMCFGAWKVEH